MRSGGSLSMHRRAYPAATVRTRWRSWRREAAGSESSDGRLCLAPAPQFQVQLAVQGVTKMIYVAAATTAPQLEERVAAACGVPLGCFRLYHQSRPLTQSSRRHSLAALLTRGSVVELKFRGRGAGSGASTERRHGAADGSSSSPLLHSSSRPREAVRLSGRKRAEGVATPPRAATSELCRPRRAATDVEELLELAKEAAERLAPLAGRTGASLAPRVHECCAALYLHASAVCEAAELARQPAFDQVCATLDGVIAALRRCGGPPRLFARTAHLTEIARRLLLTVHAALAAGAVLRRREGDKFGPPARAGRREEWLAAVRGLRRDVARAGPPPKDAGVSPSLLSLQLTALECSVLAIGDPQWRVRVAMSGANFVVGLGKAVLAGGVPNQQLISGAGELAVLSFQKVQQKLALATSSRLDSLERLAVFGPSLLLDDGDGGHDDGEGKTSSSQREVVEAVLRSLFATHFDTRSKVRWEYKGAYALAVTDLLCAEGAIKRYPEELVATLAVGRDAGLLALLSHGCEAKTRSDTAGLAMVQLSQWAEQLLAVGELHDFGAWLHDGIQIAAGEVEHAVQHSSATLSQEVQLLTEMALEETWLALLSSGEGVGAGHTPFAADGGAALVQQRFRPLVEAAATALSRLRRGVQSMRRLAATPQPLLAMASKFLRSLAHLEPVAALLGVMQRIDAAALTLEHQLKLYVADCTTTLLPREGDKAAGVSTWRLEGPTLDELHVSFVACEGRFREALIGRLQGLRAMAGRVTQTSEWATLAEEQQTWNELNARYMKVTNEEASLANSLVALTSALTMPSIARLGEMASCMRLLWHVLDASHASVSLPGAFKDLKLCGRDGTFAKLKDDLFVLLLPQLRDANRLAQEAADALVDKTRRWLVRSNDPASAKDSTVTIPSSLMAVVEQVVATFRLPERQWGTVRLIIESRIRPLRTCILRARQMVGPDRTSNAVFAMLKAEVEPAYGYLAALDGALQMFVDKAEVIEDQVGQAESLVNKLLDLSSDPSISNDWNWANEQRHEKGTSSSARRAQELHSLAAQVQDFLSSLLMKLRTHHEDGDENGVGASRADSPEKQGSGVVLAEQLVEELLNLRQIVVGGLTSLTGAGLERVDATAEAITKVLKEFKEHVQGVMSDIQGQAVESLERAAEELKDAVGEELVEAVEEVSGALSVSLLSVTKQLRTSRAASSELQAWRVREIVALCVHCVVECLRERCLDPTADVSALEALQLQLQRGLMRQLAMEPVASVRSVIKHGESSAHEFLKLRRQLNEFERPRDDNEKLHAMLLEFSIEKQRREAEAARLAEKQSAWAAVQQQLQTDMERALEEVDKLQQASQQEADPMKRQMMLLDCRKKQAQLTSTSKNVGDIGTALGVLVGFLSQIDTKLDVLNGKLDELQEIATATRHELRRLAGRPVLEAMDNVMAEIKAQSAQLPKKIYIAIEGKHVCNGRPTDSPKPLLEEVEHFLFSRNKSVMLLSGFAGSGKTEFARETRSFIATSYAQKRMDADGVRILLIYVNLPSIRNPLTNLFADALKVAPYNLRESQINDLRESIRKPSNNIEVVFVLDGYDELRPEFLWQNLYRTNNLERLRAHHEASDLMEAEDAAGYLIGSAGQQLWSSEAASSKAGSATVFTEEDFCTPKLMIFTRAELLDCIKEYENYFLPVESSTASKENVQGARKFYCEYRLASFNEDQRHAYIRALVALRVRNAFEARFGKMMPLYRGTRGALYRARQLLAGCSPISQGDSNRRTRRVLLAQLEAVLRQATVGNPDGVHLDEAAWSEGMPRLLEVVLKEFARTRSRSAYVATKDEMGVTLAALAVLHASAPTNKSFLREITTYDPGRVTQLAETDSRKLSELYSAISDDLWSFDQYEYSINSLKELASLLKTPFMVQIITEILPTLSNSVSTPASVKSELILLVSDDVAEVVSSQLEQYGITKSEADLRRHQKVLDRECQHTEIGTTETLIEVVATNCLIQLKHSLEGHKERSAALAMTPQELQGAILYAMRYKRLTRFEIFEAFMLHFLEHSETKHQVRGNVTAIAPAELRRATDEYCRRLAIKMMEDGQSKVSYRLRPGTVVFGDADE